MFFTTAPLNDATAILNIETFAPVMAKPDITDNSDIDMAVWVEVLLI